MKKSYKKMGALVLAIAMTVGVSTNAFAANKVGTYMELTVESRFGTTVGYSTKNTSTVSRYFTMALEENNYKGSGIESWTLINNGTDTVLAGGESANKFGARTKEYVRGRSVAYNSAAPQSGSAETLYITIR